MSVKLVNRIRDMNQLLFIIKKEIRVALRERLIVILGLIILLLLSVALYAGYITYQQQHKIIADTQSEKRQEWLNQGDKHPHIAAHFGTFVFKPKTILSLFDFGLDAYTGTSVYLEAHFQHEFMFRSAQDHSSMIRFGELSAALVLQILVPLLIIFLAFSSFTQERESGTLRLVLSQGATFRLLTWGKIISYCIMLTCILAPLLAGILWMSSSGVDSTTVPDVAIRVLLLIVLYVIYLFLFIAISVWVSIRSSTGRNALLTLLTCWIFFAILMPKAVANLSETLYPLPSMRTFKAEIEDDKLNGFDGKTPRSVRINNLESEYLNKYGVDSVEQLPFNFEAVMMQSGEDFGNRVYDHHFSKLHRIMENQSFFGSVLTFVNPFMAIQHLSMGLSGTDLYSSGHFENEVEKYRRDMVREMNNDMAMNSKYGEFYEYKAGENLWNQIEDFVYTSPSVINILRYYKLELSALVLWLVFILWLIHFTNQKMKLLNE